MNNDDIIIEEGDEREEKTNTTNPNFIENMFDNVFKNLYGADSLNNDYIRNSFEAIKNRYKDESGNMNFSKLVSEAQNMGMNEEAMNRAREMANSIINKNNSTSKEEENNDVIVED